MLIPQANGDFAALNERIMGAVSAKAVLAAVDLRLFDRLEGVRMDAAALAAAMGLVSERLEPLLDILVALDLLTRTASGYGNTPLTSEFLVSGAPLYQGDYLAMTIGFAASIEKDMVWLLAGGKPDREGNDYKWSMERRMNGSAQNALRGGAAAVADVAAALPGFADFRAMCDIGGNHGLYTMAVLERNPALRGVIYDLPPVAAQSKLRCERMGYGDRVEARGMDFREAALPEAAYDLALTSHVLYSFKDDLPGTLARIAAGLKPGGWFLSHHYCDRDESGHALQKASLELVTRLAGYPSHFIGREELRDALRSAGFGEPVFTLVSGSEMDVIGVARLE